MPASKTAGPNEQLIPEELEQAHASLDTIEERLDRIEFAYRRGDDLTAELVAQLDRLESLAFEDVVTIDCEDTEQGR
jgi:hypothetical protein